MKSRNQKVPLICTCLRFSKVVLITASRRSRQTSTERRVRLNWGFFFMRVLICFISVGVKSQPQYRVMMRQVGGRQRFCLRILSISHGRKTDRFSGALPFMPRFIANYFARVPNFFENMIIFLRPRIFTHMSK